MSKSVRFESEWEQAGFVKLPRPVLYHPELSQGAKLLYAALAGHAWEDEACWPGQEGLAVNLGAAVSTVRRWTRELEQAGLIAVEQRGMHLTNRYVLLSHSPMSVPDRSRVSGQDRPPMSDEVEAEGIETESNSCDEVEEVFAHYLSAFPNKRQKKADEGQRKVIRNALKVATADELKRCIDACACSDWHQRRGEHENRAGGKHNSLSLILAPKSRGANYPSGRTQREQIDYWLARESKGGMSGEERERRIEEWVEARNIYANGEGPDPGATPWEKESTE